MQGVLGWRNGSARSVEACIANTRQQSVAEIDCCEDDVEQRTDHKNHTHTHSLAFNIDSMHVPGMFLVSPARQMHSYMLA